MSNEENVRQNSVNFGSLLFRRLTAVACITASLSVSLPPGVNAAAASIKPIKSTGQNAGADLPIRIAAEPAGAEAGGASLPTLSELVEKALSAYGGKASLNQMLVNVTLFGTQSGGDNPRPLTFRRMRKGDKWRIDLDPAETTEAQTPASTQTQAQPAPAQAAATTPAAKQGIMLGYDGSDGWECANNETSTLGPDKVAWLTQEETRQPSLLANWEEKGYSFVFKGKTQYKQQPAYALEITQEGGTPTTLYLDTNNYLVNGLTYEMPVTSGDEKSSSKSTVVLDYGEYQPTCNTLWPFKIVETVNDKLASEMKLSAVNAITAIADSSFARPNMGAVYHLPKPITVPFEYSQKEIVVKGRLNNGEEVNFLFDTGASDTIIDRRAAAQHFLAKEERYDIAAVSGMVSASSSQIDRLELGNMILNNLKARIFDLSAQSRSMGRPIAGVIGTNVISRFLVTLDYGRQTITFADIDSAPRPSNSSSLSFTQKQAPYVKASFNGKDQYTMLMDTGAAFNHIPTAIAHNYLKNDPAHVKHVTEGTGLDGRPVQLGQVLVESVAVANLALHRVVFTYPIKSESKAQQQAQREGGFFQVANLGILGNPYWENFIITIDYKFGRLLLIPNPSFKVRNDIAQSLTAGDTALYVHRDYRQAELSYQRALIVADNAQDVKEQARASGRLGNLRRIMAKDLNRPEHAKAAYTYFTKAQEKALKSNAQDVLGRILGDWSLLYSDNGQALEAKQTIDRALSLAPQDPYVNVDCAVHLYRARMFSEMQKYIEKALFLEPSNWQALWYQVKLSEGFFDTPKEIATLKDILRFYPWSKVASDKLKRLTALTAPPQKEPASSSGNIPSSRKE